MHMVVYIMDPVDLKPAAIGNKYQKNFNWRCSGVP